MDYEYTTRSSLADAVPGDLEATTLRLVEGVELPWQIEGGVTVTNIGNSTFVVTVVLKRPTGT